MQSATITPESIRSVADSVFRQRAYDRSISGALWRRIIDTVGQWLSDFLRSIREVPSMKWVLLAIGAVIVVAIVLRGIVLARADRRAASRIRVHRKDDLWKSASDAASAGNFLEAAHLLYLAMIHAVAERERLRLHPAKTIGDYARDLRRSSSPVLPAFAEFARAYQPIVWGSKQCDVIAYERLHRLAESVRNAA